MIGSLFQGQALHDRKSGMFNFLYQISNIFLFIFLSVTFISVSIIGVFIIKRFSAVDLRYRDNSVLGSIGSLIGVIYGVLAGLTALYLINNVSYTTDAVQREASAVANIYRDSQWLDEPAKSDIKDAIKKYLNTVINVEWPLMGRGKTLNSAGNNFINSIASEVNQYIHTHPAESLVMQDMLAEIKALYDAREQRIHMSFSSLNSEMWVVILIGTILTIGINYLFKMKLKLHLISISAVALMASSMVFLLLTLDRPFQGEFVIEPTAFESVLSSIH